eukprot:gene3397-3441_t
MPAELQSTSQGQTLILTLRNPERRNAIDPVMYAAGVEALGVAESSPDIRSVVITGADGMFCSGGNLQRLLANRQQPPEVQANVALSPDGGASWSLAHALPRQIATEILMCGDRIGAERLHALGLVNRLAEAGNALDTALALAEQLNARAPNALASIKELLNEAPHAQLTHHLGHERDHFVKNLHHANGGAGISAFLEKRVPRYEPINPRYAATQRWGFSFGLRADTQSPKRQAMDDPILTIEEREAINSGRWFSSLSPSLRHDILRCAYVKRFKDGGLIAARGDPPEEWIACARGAVRVSSTSISGKQITLTYVEPGIWFGDVAIFDGDRRTHDAYAHGDTTILCVAKADFRKILAVHTELYEAMLRLHARRIRQLFGLVEDLNTLPLRSRLAKQLVHLVRSYGVPSLSDGSEMRISLQLAQEELAQLLGASRQRVNQELKAMEREDAIRIEPGGLVVRDREALMRIAEADN